MKQAEYQASLLNISCFYFSNNRCLYTINLSILFCGTKNPRLVKAPVDKPEGNTFGTADAAISSIFGSNVVLPYIIGDQSEPNDLNSGAPSARRAAKQSLIKI